MCHLLNCELLMDEESKHKACPNEIVMAERIELFIVGPLHHSVPPHAPNNRQRAPDEHQLHDSVVEGDEVREQIQVPSQKHQRIQLLSLERNP